MRKPGMSADEKNEVYLNGRRLAVSLLAMLLVVAVLIALSAAWFSRSGKIKAAGRGVTVGHAGSTHFTLYEWSGASPGEGGWIETSAPDLSGFVPNETRRYLIAARDSSFSKVKFDFYDIVSPGTENLLDFLYLAKVSEGGAVTADPETAAVTYDYMGVPPPFFAYGDRSAQTRVSAEAFEISCTGKTAVIDLYLSKDVCGAFSEWGFRMTVKID